MCQHCSHKDMAPSSSIPYSCPHCPVRQVEGKCHAPYRAAYRKEEQKYRYPTALSSHRPVRQCKLCQDISEFYSNVVADKSNDKTLRWRKRLQPIAKSLPLERCAGGTVGLAGTPTQQTQHTLRFDTMDSLGIDSRHYLYKDVPLLQKEHLTENGTWTWATPTKPKSNKVLAVAAHTSRHTALFGCRKCPAHAIGWMPNLTPTASLYPLSI